ncbi:MAG TPA: phage antirepressor [Erysipelotrichaceae bacterium]|nr:phage antirepressor [Erysipelotrichaceae bacterium]
MQQLEIFKYQEKNIRTVLINNEPWFVAKDVCNVLGIKNITQAMSRLDSDERSMSNIGRQGNANIVNESGLYAIILRSDKEEAKEFRKWVTSEVLPTIRKKGMFLTVEMVEKTITDPGYVLGVLQAYSDARNEITIKDQIIGELQPKSDYLDVILQSQSSMPITQIAKDYGKTAIEMNQLLHDLKVQFKVNEQWVLYQFHQAKGYTRSVTVSIVRGDGRPDTKLNTQWTQRGRVFLYNLLKEHNILPLIEKRRT